MNCTIVNNDAGGLGGGIRGTEGLDITLTLDIFNSILWDNQDTNGTGGTSQISQGGIGAPIALTVAYSDVAGGVWAGTENISADPVFADPDGADNILGNDDDDYRLEKPCSPCVDAGDPDDGGTTPSSCDVGGYSVPCALECPVSGGIIDCDESDIDGDSATDEPLPSQRTVLTALATAKRVLDGEGEAGNDACIDMGAYEFIRICCPWDCEATPDGTVGNDDLFALNGQWDQECTSCDFGIGAPGVGNGEINALLAHWGDCDCGEESSAGGGTEDLDEALATMGFESVDDFIAWTEEASPAELEAAIVVLIALLSE